MLNRRTPSGPWGRLKPVVLDPLENIGLPSKGDMRLLDATAQEQYYTKIVERYMTFCSDAGQRDELLRRFSSLDIGEESALSSARRRPDSPSSLEVLQGAAGTKALAEVLAALRKLREA
ncbi:hypothetical protein RJ55_07922 [Drechmeria coniospora]|nr:hypothetical protein RJ55_07922 [Drechmeria coniospora]